MQISLKGPGGFVDIGPAGVTIQGTMVLINSGGSAGSGSGSSPSDPADPKDPKWPQTADDGSKGGALG
jgi:type VI secretion system secreted protein VgrG